MPCPVSTNQMIVVGVAMDDDGHVIANDTTQSLILDTHGDIVESTRDQYFESMTISVRVMLTAQKIGSCRVWGQRC